MIHMHAIKGKKIEPIDWGDDFAFEVQAKFNFNSEYDLFANSSTQQNNFNIIVTNDDGYEQIYLGKSSSNIINFPTAGKYYIKCVGTYDGFQFQYSDINEVEFKKILNWGTNEWKDLTGMFNGCMNLSSIDFEDANFEGVTTMYQTFEDCRNLENLEFGSNTFENVTIMYQTFYNCRSLTALNLSTLNLNKVTNIQQAFLNCTNLENLDFGDNTFENVTSINYTFGLKNGKLPNISKFIITNLTAFYNNFSDSAENRTMYEYILSVWWSPTLPNKSPAITLGFGSVKVNSQAQIYKTNLSSRGYILQDGGNL